MYSIGRDTLTASFLDDAVAVPCVNGERSGHTWLRYADYYECAVCGATVDIAFSVGTDTPELDLGDGGKDSVPYQC